MVTVKKKRKKKRPKKRSQGRQWLVRCVVALLFMVLGGLLVLMFLGGDESAVPVERVEVAPPEPVVSYEEIKVVADPVVVEQRAKKHQVSQVEDDTDEPITELARPLVAIVIDDMGYNKKTCEALLALDMNLSFAFLPFGPYTEQQAAKAKRLGRDILLHFPMEASDASARPGPGTVTIDMDEATIRRVFTENLASVPYAVGINNHMGSRFTQNHLAMQAFMGLVRQSGLFFLDSRTSRNSVGFFMARKMAVQTAKRNIFLDNVRDPQKIITQLHKLVAVARRHGSAVAIGHPYPETLQALQEYQRGLSGQVKVVRVGSLVR